MEFILSASKGRYDGEMVAEFLNEFWIRDTRWNCAKDSLPPNS
jgi:hypothetical protein